MNDVRAPVERQSTAREAVAAADRAASRMAWLGAFWERDPDAERSDAAAVDACRERLPLAGLTVTVKACIDVGGLETTWGVVGAAATAAADAESVRRLRSAGAVVVGKSAMDQLGWTVSGAAAGFPRCANPIAPLLSPGGSSTGSAAAVAAGIVDVGLGTDLAGSVRIPAACCGIVGFKPAVGVVPFDGYDTLVADVDAIGVLARSVRDAQAAYEVIAGVAVPRAVRTPRLGILSDLGAAAPTSVQRALHEAARRMGAEASTLRLDWRPRGLGRIFASALRNRVGEDVDHHPARYGDDIVSSVARGAQVAGADVADALATLRAERVEIGRALASFDVVMAPTLVTDVPARDAESPVESLTTATRIFSSLGWAAAAIPVGQGSSAAPPPSVQLACAPGREPELFELARRLERSS